MTPVTYHIHKQIDVVIRPKVAAPNALPIPTRKYCSDESNNSFDQKFKGDNLCEVIQRANKNGDLGFESEYGKASLFIKYVGMLKLRDCFGF